MTEKEIQDKLWSIVSEENKKEFIKGYRPESTKNVYDNFNSGYNHALVDIFGEHNLLPNIEIKEESDLVEFLKDCIGEEFFSYSYGSVIIDEIDKSKHILIKPKGYTVGREVVYSDGRLSRFGNVDLYPSEYLLKKYPLNASSAWKEWKESRKTKR